MFHISIHICYFLTLKKKVFFISFRFNFNILFYYFSYFHIFFHSFYFLEFFIGICVCAAPRERRREKNMFLCICGVRNKKKCLFCLCVFYKIFLWPKSSSQITCSYVNTAAVQKSHNFMNFNGKIRNENENENNITIIVNAI